MNIKSITVLGFQIALTGMIFSGAGCQNSMPKNSSRTSLGKVEFKTAFEVCRDVMAQEFGVVSADPETAVIKARPEPYELSGGSAIHFSAQQHRRSANLNLHRQDRQWWVYVEVSIERKDTQSYSQFQSQRSGSDHGVSTPMETNESAPLGKRDVWTKVRRDVAMEKKIISRIREQLGMTVLLEPPAPKP